MKNIIFAPVFLFVLSFASCSYDPVEKSNLFLSEQEINEIISDGRLYTLDEIKDSFMTERGNFFDSVQTYRTRSYKYIGVDTLFLFSIDTLPKNGPSIYIRGRITTDDMAGNFYKSFVIQQMVKGQQQALRISVDISSIGGSYQKGQEILIRCNGLALGRYANQPQLCVPSYNNNIYANKAEEKVGWAPGRIPAPLFKNAVYRIGLPDISKIHYDEYTIEEITGPTSIMNAKCAYNDQSMVIKNSRYMDGLAVVLRNLHCTGEYANTTPELLTTNTYNPSLNDINGTPDDPNANLFAPTTQNMGYPQSRIFASANDNQSATNPLQRSVINLSTSEYARYAHFFLPARISTDSTGNLTFNYEYFSGDIYGILGFYMDNGNYDADKFSWSVSPSSLQDLHLKDSVGRYWNKGYNIEFGESF